MSNLKLSLITRAQLGAAAIEHVVARLGVRRTPTPAQQDLLHGTIGSCREQAQLAGTVARQGEGSCAGAAAQGRVRSAGVDRRARQGQLRSAWASVPNLAGTFT